MAACGENSLMERPYSPVQMTFKSADKPFKGNMAAVPSAAQGSSLARGSSHARGSSLAQDSSHARGSSLAQDSSHARGSSLAQDSIPPDGGWGWAVVLAAFISIGLSYALPKSLAIYYRDIQECFSVSSSEIAWVSSIMMAAMYAGGPVSSILVNRYDSRPVVMIGGLMVGIAMTTASFGRSIMHLYLCVGVIGGFGLALNLQPSLAIIGKYFSIKRPIANGLAMAGSPVFLSGLAPLNQFLSDGLGWRGGFLVLGALLLNCCVAGALMRPIKTKQQPNKSSASSARVSPEEGAESNTPEEGAESNTPEGAESNTPEGAESNTPEGAESNTPEGAESNTPEEGAESNTPVEGAESNTPVEGAESNTPEGAESNTPEGAEGHTPSSNHHSEHTEPQRSACADHTGLFLDLSVFKHRGFLIYLVGNLVMFLGFFSPVVFLAPYAKHRGINEYSAAGLLSIFALADMLARPGTGLLASTKWIRPRIQYLFSFAVTSNGVCHLLCPLLTSYAGLVVYVVCFGVAFGMVCSLMFEVLNDLVGTRRFPSAVGIVTIVECGPVLLGPPISGTLVDIFMDYKHMYYACGVMMLLPGLFLFIMNYFNYQRLDQEEKQRQSQAGDMGAPGTSAGGEGDREMSQV